jgi:hypothetical protein
MTGIMWRSKHTDRNFLSLALQVEEDRGVGGVVGNEHSCVSHSEFPPMMHVSFQVHHQVTEFGGP